MPHYRSDVVAEFPRADDARPESSASRGPRDRTGLLRYVPLPTETLCPIALIPRRRRRVRHGGGRTRLRASSPCSSPGPRRRPCGPRPGPALQRVQPPRSPTSAELDSFVALGPRRCSLAFIGETGLWRGLALACCSVRRPPTSSVPLTRAVGLRRRRAGVRRLERPEGRRPDPARVAFAVVGGADYADDLRVVFVVVLFSVVVQGTLVPTVASRLGVPMAPARRRSLVGVEAAPGLPAEDPAFHHRDEARRRRHPRLPELRRRAPPRRARGRRSRRGRRACTGPSATRRRSSSPRRATRA